MTSRSHSRSGDHRRLLLSAWPAGGPALPQPALLALCFLCFCSAYCFLLSSESLSRQRWLQAGLGGEKPSASGASQGTLAANLTANQQLSTVDQPFLPALSLSFPLFSLLLLLLLDSRLARQPVESPKTAKKGQNAVGKKPAKDVDGR